MHAFQPYPIDLIEFDPFTKIGKEWMLITAKHNDKINAMTASWGGVGVLWGKNTTFIFVSRISPTYIVCKSPSAYHFSSIS